MITLDWGLVNNSVENIPSIGRADRFKKKKEEAAKEKDTKGDIILKDFYTISLFSF